MSVPSDSLTSLSQLDEFNREVWLITERDRKISQGLHRQEFVDTLPPCENPVIANEATTEAEVTDAALPKSSAESLTTPSNDI